MSNATQHDMFAPSVDGCALPLDCQPARVPHFDVETIVFAKGSLDTPERERFAQRVCDVYPEAAVVRHLDTPHNRIELDASEQIARHDRGKHTLVIGVLGNSVRFSEERGNTCPNYWHFSVYGYCPFQCGYCYLAGTHGVWFSPTVRLYINLDEIMAKIDRVARRAASPTAFYHGKLQDGLALDPLTGYSTVLVPFFARHRYARQVLLTKSTSVERLLDLDHRGHTTLSWSLGPPEIAARHEANVPTVDERIAAMRRCSERGYPVRAVLMPIIPDGNDWSRRYAEFAARLVADVRLDRLTLGGICIYPQARGLMESRLGRENAISTEIAAGSPTDDGRQRYSVALRVRAYQGILDAVRDVRPELDVALCLEEPAVFTSLKPTLTPGRCNCVL